MCARPGVLTSKLAFHAPPPPCPPSVSASTPNKTAGRGRNQGGYLPTYRAVVSLGNLSLHVSALRLARSKQK